jgi:hypothetical protein
VRIRIHINFTSIPFWRYIYIHTPEGESDVQFS